MFGSVDYEEVCCTVQNKVGKTTQELEEQISYLRKWLLKQPHLPHSADDILLRSFVLGTSSMEQAKQKLDNYYSYRNKYKFLTDRDPHLIKWQTAIRGVHLPGTTPEGYRVYFIKVPNVKQTEKFELAESCKSFAMDLEYILNENMIISGHKLVLDMKNMSTQFLLKMSPILAGQMFNTYQNVFPIKIKGIICFNCSYLADSCLNVFVHPFLSDKIKTRVYTSTGGPAEVAKYVPLHMFPRDYGGNTPAYQDQMELSRERLIKLRDWFLTEGSYRSDESKRPPPSTDEYGVQGTFRRLNID